MCKETRSLLKKVLLSVFFLSLWLASAALQAEEQWYLISETELRSIEAYKATSEQEKQSWLSQAQSLRLESASLNSQLATVREQNRSLEQSFNKYESDQLTLVATKNGEIADLNKEKADLKTRAVKAEGQAALRLAMVIGLSVVIIGYIALKIYLKFKGIRI